MFRPMRIHPLRSLLAAAALLAAACNGGTTPNGDDVTSGGEACDADRVRLGGSVCWSAEGTRWRVQAQGPGGQTYDFRIKLLAGGRVRATDHAGASPAMDEWTQDGALLRIFLSDRFVEYRTEVTNGTLLLGDATNVRGRSWPFRAERVFAPGRCAEDEVALESGACFTVAGTRWRVTVGATERVVALLAEGRVAVDDADIDEADSWSQDGAAFTLSLGGTAYTATLDDADRVGGPGWSAERIELLPPPVH
jgi:predicted small secreted protein